MRVSTKLALVVAGVTAVCAGLALWVGLSVEAEARRAAFRETHTRALELLALALAPAMAAGDHHAVQATHDNVANFPDRYPDILALEVLDRQGQVVGALDPRRFGDRVDAAEDLALRRASGRALSDDRSQIVVPIVLTYSLGVLRATLDEGPLIGELKRIRRGALLATVAWAVVLAATLSLLLRRVFARRIERLSEVVSRLQADPTNDEARADERGADEVAELGRSFNRMAAELAARTVGLEALVEARTAALAEANTRLAELATSDPLTGLRNRRFFDEQLAQLRSIAERGQRPLAVALLDVDHFKSVNDTFGHAVGDVVLVDVAATLQRHARASDVVARVGGEEFALLLPDTDREVARVALERMRAALASAPHPDAPELGERRITASAGIAVYPDDDPEGLMVAADRALYAAKHAGRNQVTTTADPEAQAERPS